MGAKRHVERGGAAALAGLLLITATAVAQDAKTLAELKRWHDKLTESNAVLSVQDGRQVRAQLKTWGLSVNELELEQRGWLLRLEIAVALAMGNARRAAQWLPDLQLDFPDARATVRGVAGGRCHRRCRVGQAIAREAESTRGGQEYGGVQAAAALADDRPAGAGHRGDHREWTDGCAARRNGVVLVLDFWNRRDKPGDEQVKALRGLYEALAGVGKVEFLGVNADGPAQVKAARRFAADNGYSWPQHYERRTSGAPLTHKAFRVDSSPWQIVIDGEGNVRAVGSASEAAFVYALRAAVAEARGEYPPVRPKTTDGKPAPRPKPEPPAVEPEPKAKEGPPPQVELPSNPEARTLLTRARLFRKTGKRTEAKKLLKEVIEKYPGTREAKEAAEMLPYY